MRKMRLWYSYYKSSMAQCASCNVNILRGNFLKKTFKAAIVTR